MGCFHASIVIVLLGFLMLVSVPTEAATKKYQFDVSSASASTTLQISSFSVPCPWFLLLQVVVSNVSRLCHAKPVVTVNGRLPGPTIYAREGDRLIVNVTNYAQYNMTIHWYMTRTHHTLIPRSKHARSWWAGTG